MCHFTFGVELRVISRLLGFVVVMFLGLVGQAIAIPSASADPCPDVEVVFARGTFEPPGVGSVGDAFVDGVRTQAAGRSVDVYPVNYPASLDFQTAADGVIDASNRVRDMAARCPDTSMVLGGYSQGAAVIGYLTVDAVPVGYDLPAGITGPMPADVADHVAAVALFGKPSQGFLQRIDTAAPPINVGHLYSGKTLDLCIPEDPICSASGSDNGAHGQYVANGMTAQAVDYAVHHLPTKPGAPAPRPSAPPVLAPTA
jgi:cutinase